MLLSELGLEGLNFGFSADLKLILMLCGKQNAASKYCCPFCSGCSPWTGECQSTTIGHLRECYQSFSQFSQSGGKIQNAKDYNNVIHKPLILGPDDAKVLSYVHFPELHVTLGIVGKLIKELEVKCFSSPEDGTAFMNT